MRLLGRVAFLITTVFLCCVIIILVITKTTEEAQYSRAINSLVSDIRFQQARKINNSKHDIRNENRLLILNEEQTTSAISLSKTSKNTPQRLNDPDHVPNHDHEALTRKIFNGVVELSYAIETEIYSLSGTSSREEAISRLRNQQRSVLLDVEDLANQFGGWREKEWNSLQDLVRRRIEYVQNPKNCSSAKKLMCSFKQSCGFGCQLHYLSYCFMVAYGLQRTLVIDHGSWSYEPRGWTHVFLPPSENCTRSFTTPRKWGGEFDPTNDETILVNPMQFSTLPDFVPIAIPEDLAPRLMRLHGAPFVWWMGQFVRYLLRPQPWLQNYLVAAEKDLEFQSPVVGIHVRRTDKRSEAAFHGIEEYMKHVVEWFDKYDMRLSRDKTSKKAVRRVYIATDDPSVLPAAMKRYPEYTFISDTNISKSASLHTRYSNNSLRGLLVDVHLLSKCSYAVCTFSSQICRLVYELMQTRRPDASTNAHSLDDVYFFTGMTRGRPHVAIYDHKARPVSDEIDLLVGDKVQYAGNHWDGFSKGKNLRTLKTGLFPSYKVMRQIPLAKYPTFPRTDVDSYSDSL